MIKSLHFEVIPHRDQRYPTIGDYWESPPGSGHWEIRVSDLGDWRMNLLVFVHEITELAQTENDGIPEPVIKDFDVKFEIDHDGSDAEPGDCPQAPYDPQHVFAECQERLLAQRLGINWTEYDQHCMAIWRSGVASGQDEFKLSPQAQFTTPVAECPGTAEDLRMRTESPD